MTLLVHYSTDYVAAAHAFDTTRKAAWVADAVRGIEGVNLVAPSARWDAGATEAAIWRVHDAGYVDALATGVPRHLAESQGFVWDPGLWTAVRSSTAGVLSAVDVVLERAVAGAGPAAGGARLSGSLSSGMHHAKFATGDGFCSVNGLVVAAAHAVAVYGADVTVLDVDAHAGGGTDELLRHHGDTLGLARVRRLDLTTKPFDSYMHHAARPGDVNVEDPTLDGDDDRYLDAVDALLARLPDAAADRPHLVLHNAGMDPSPGISFDVLAERERRVAAALVGRGLAGVFVLAGGYTWSATPDEVAAAHASTVRAFAAHATSRTAKGEVSA